MWFLLFVILGVGLGTSFIAGGSVLGAGLLAGGLGSARGRTVLEARLTTTGLVFAIATFVVLAVVLSALALWVGVVAALTVLGAYDTVEAAFRDRPPASEVHRPQPASAARYDGHDRTREPAMAR